MAKKKLAKSPSKRPAPGKKSVKQPSRTLPHETAAALGLPHNPTPGLSAGKSHPAVRLASYIRAYLMEPASRFSYIAEQARALELDPDHVTVGQVLGMQLVNDCIFAPHGVRLGLIKEVLDRMDGRIPTPREEAADDTPLTVVVKELVVEAAVIGTNPASSPSDGEGDA